MGFLYILVVKVPCFCGVMSVSRNGMEPSGLVSSVVKLMEGSTELMCCKKYYFCDCCSMTIASSTYLFHDLGGFTADVKALCSRDSTYKLSTIGLTGDPMAAPWFVHKIDLGTRSRCYIKRI